VKISRSLGFFVVFEPSYALGCLALLSSLTRHASEPVAVDILTRAQYRDAAQQIVHKLHHAYGAKLDARIIVVPQEIIAECSAHKFRGHFIPEVLFRLYYFEVVSDHRDYVVHLDLDMMLLSDIFAIRRDLEAPALLHVVEAPMTDQSRPVTPPHIKRYLNAGLLAFDASDRRELQQTLRAARAIVAEIASKALYLDQDAINIAFHDAISYLPEKWNFTLSHFKGFPIPADVVVLHATGSRKPWFFRGRHPYTAWYLKEADLLGLPFSRRYDFAWGPRRVLKKAKGLLAG
jgi:lipopolysaccharide biosynthesis glycosyltransferase